MYLTYAAPRGHALIDRALYLPKSWTEDSDRCDRAGIPHAGQGFCHQTEAGHDADRPRGRAADVPAAWVAGDEVYGADPRLRAAVRDHGLGYVLAVAANRRVPTHAGPIRVDALPALIPPAPGSTTPPAPERTARGCTRGPGFGCWPKTTPTPVCIIC